MSEIIEILKFGVIGSILGLSAGLSPGPLLTLVITETLKHNRKSGFRVAVSPLITDFPIILLSVYLFTKIAELNSLLGAVAFLGAAYIGYQGIETLRVRELHVGAPNGQPHSLKKGIIANFLSPHPYLFWITVGSSFVFNAFELSVFASILFFVSFYICLIGSKLMVAQLVYQTKIKTSNSLYLWVMRFLGTTLLIFSALFVWEGIKYLELI